LILLALCRGVSLCGLHFLQLPNQKISRVCRRQDFRRCVLVRGFRLFHGRVQFPRGYSQLPYRRSAISYSVNDGYDGSHKSRRSARRKEHSACQP
jgi:hypothetical protein